MRYVLIFCLLLVAGNVYADVQQVFLIQNSGWMEPFFEDSQSKLRPLTCALIQAISLPDQDIIVATFNQDGAVAGENSPKLVYKGKPAPEKVKAVVDSLKLPKRPDGKFADADFQGALNGTLLRLVKRQPAVIWLITNNKNDPNNSPDVITHTKGFYRLLREHPAIGNLLAFPISMAVKGRYFQEGGLMIYCLSFGEPADSLFSRIIDSKKLKALFTGRPIRLKPLEKQPLLFEPKEVLTPKIHASTQAGKLVLFGLESLKRGGVIMISGRLFSNYYPQDITSADLSLDWASFGNQKGPGLPNEIKPTSLKNLSTGGVIDNVLISIQIPPLPSVWSSDSLFSNGYTIKGVLRISLTNLNMSLSPDFRKKMESVFGLGQLPEIFYPNKKIQNAETLLPVQMSVEYPVWPLALLLACMLLIAVSSLFVLIMMGRERRYKVEVNGQLVPVAVKPFRTIKVYSESVAVAEIRGALFGKPSLEITNEDYRVKLR